MFIISNTNTSIRFLSRTCSGVYQSLLLGASPDSCVEHASLLRAMVGAADGAASLKRSAAGNGSESVAKRGRTGGKSGASHAKLTFKSPAEFFAENKNIAGFDK